MTKRLDPQTKAVYAWEEEWRPWNWKDFDTLYYPRRIIQKACSYYRVPTPIVQWGPPHTYPEYDPNGHIIRVRATTNNASQALHEAAHAIHDWLLGTDGLPHSPEFMGIYLWSIVKYRLAPLRAVLASLEGTGIQYIHPNRMSPKAVRARYRTRIHRTADERDT